MRRAAKLDSNHAAIVRALRQLGVLWRCRAEGEYGELGRPVTDRAVQGGLEVLDAVLALDAQPLIYAEDDGGIRFELALPYDDVRIHPRGWAYTLNDDDTEKPFPPEAP